MSFGHVDGCVTNARAHRWWFAPAPVSWHNLVGHKVQQQLFIHVPVCCNSHSMACSVALKVRSIPVGTVHGAAHPKAGRHRQNYLIFHGQVGLRLRWDISTCGKCYFPQTVLRFRRLELRSWTLRSQLL
jgi:hypothetical protein